MAAPSPKRQREGWATLNRVFEDAANVWVVHYSCESFYDRVEGRSPRITSIALRKLNSAQTVSFSIHQVAERRRVRSTRSSSITMILRRKCLRPSSIIWAATRHEVPALEHARCELRIPSH